MERRSVSLSTGGIAYLAQTTSWHPTFEVLFVGRGRSSCAFFEEVGRALAPYGNVFILDLKQFGMRSPAGEVDGLLEWTKATGVRKPVLVGCPASFETAARFAGTAPQFTLGVVIVPGTDPAPEAGLLGIAARVLRAAASLVRGAAEPTVDEIAAGLSKLEVSHLDASAEGDAVAVAARIRTFASAIKPSSPARERRPLRRAGREA